MSGIMQKPSRKPCLHQVMLFELSDLDGNIFGGASCRSTPWLDLQAILFLYDVHKPDIPSSVQS